MSNRTPEATTALADASKADLQAVTASMASLQADNLFSNFRGLNIPTLLVYGEKDVALTIPSEETSNSTMTQQITLEESGHFPMLDETIKFNRLMTDFLALESGASPSELELKEEWKRRVR
jgi:pimeloyl-ACP methyl ester carboxylesterase